MDGDDTRLSTQDIPVNADEPLKLGEKQKKDWNNSMPSMDKDFKFNEDMVKSHLITAQEVTAA